MTIIKEINYIHTALTQESYNIFKHVQNYGLHSLLNKKEDFRQSILFKTIKNMERDKISPPSGSWRKPLQLWQGWEWEKVICLVHLQNLIAYNSFLIIRQKTKFTV